MGLALARRALHSSRPGEAGNPNPNPNLNPNPNPNPDPDPDPNPNPNPNPNSTHYLLLVCIKDTGIGISKEDQT